MVIAVTGASGHIGSNLARRLVKEGHSVRAQYRTAATPLEAIDVEACAGDILDPDFVSGFVGGAEIVFHLAAEISIAGDPTGSVRRTNVDGTRIVAQACLQNNVRRVIHFSSIHAFEQLPRDERLDEQRSYVGPAAFDYDRSKADGERVIREAVVRGLDAVIVNPTAVVGPVDFRPSSMGQVIAAMARGQMPAIVDGGFDWVDVRDVVDGAVLAIEKGRCGQNYLLSGTWASLQEIAGLVDAACGSSSRRLVLPIWMARAVVPLVALVARVGGAPPVFTRESLAIVSESNRAIRHSRASQELGFRSRPLRETIDDTVRWFINNAYL